MPATALSTAPAVTGAPASAAAAKASSSAVPSAASVAASAGVDTSKLVVVGERSRAIRRLMSVVRAAGTDQKAFVVASDRVMRLLTEEALAELPHEDVTVTTPCGPYDGCVLKTDSKKRSGEAALTAVSIVRSGNVLLEAVRDVVPDVGVGHVLVQRDESDPEKRPIFFYKKFPKGVADGFVLLCDPMLATGGSAKAAIECLVKEGVAPEKILFVNLIAAPEGVRALLDGKTGGYPNLYKVVTAEMDEKLNESKYIVPGLGDFGDRYYNTVD